MKGWINTPPFPNRNYKNAFEFVLASNNVFYERASLKSHNSECTHLFYVLFLSFNYHFNSILT